MYWVRGGVIEWFCKKRIARFLWDHFCSHLCTTTSLHYTACHNLCMYCCWSAVQNSKCKQIWHTMSTRRAGGWYTEIDIQMHWHPAGGCLLCAEFWTDSRISMNFVSPLSSSRPNRPPWRCTGKTATTRRRLMTQHRWFMFLNLLPFFAKEHKSDDERTNKSSLISICHHVVDFKLLAENLDHRAKRRRASNQHLMYGTRYAAVQVRRCPMQIWCGLSSFKSFSLLSQRHLKNCGLHHGARGWGKSWPPE